MFSERSPGGSAPARQVLRLGARANLGELPTVPPRYRGAMGGPSGVLASARLRARTGELWCRLGRSRPWARDLRTVPINTTQPPAPTPDALELRRHLRVDCQAGRVGRLEGMVVDTHTGLATELLIQVRGDVAADIAGPTDPLGPLLRVQGQRVLVPPAWATKAEQAAGMLPFFPAQARIVLAATAVQVAHGLILRDDASLTADVWAILAANPAIEPALSHVRVQVRDGMVTLLGSLPSVRHRLSAEQDVWHVPGVLGVRNETSVRGEA
jgi:hypothetical protein